MLQWCHSQQGSRQLTVQIQQLLWKTAKEGVAESLTHLLCLSTKIQVHTTVVIPTLLYGAETEVLNRKQIRLLEWFHQGCLHSILGIKLQNCVSNKEVLKSQPAQHRVHFASDVAALGWPPHKDGRHTHAQSSLLWRPAEETACTGRNQPSVMTAGGVWSRQLALICGEKPAISLRQRGTEVQEKDAVGRESEQHPNHPQP